MCLCFLLLTITFPMYLINLWTLHQLRRPQGYQEDKMPPVSPRVLSHWGRGHHLLQRERHAKSLWLPRQTAAGFPQYIVNHPQQACTIYPLKVLDKSNASSTSPPQHALKSTTPEQFFNTNLNSDWRRPQGLRRVK